MKAWEKRVALLVFAGAACGGCDNPIGEKNASQPSMSDFQDSPVTINYGSGNDTDNSRRDNPPKE